jgi:aminopeptidase N
MGLTTDQYPGLLYSAIIYGRGPLFLVTLQELMGPEQFTAFLQDYYRTYQWDVATTDGFKALAEAHCACDLSTLFETWVYPR